MTGTKPCKHWAVFKCNYGDACGFSHAGPGGPSEKGVYVLRGAAAKSGAADAQEAEEAQRADSNPLSGVSVADPATLEALGIDFHTLIAQYAIEHVLGEDDDLGDGETGSSLHSASPSDGGLPKLGPCKHWAAHRCNHGDACQFSHDGPGGACPQGEFSETCKHWVEYRCNYGDACKFSHDGPGGASSLDRELLNVLEETQDTYSDDESEPRKQRLDQLLGTGDDHDQVATGVSSGGAPPCKFWALGKCNFANCRFSHDGPGSPSPLGTFAFPEAPNPSKVCVHFLAGRCNHGEKCGFSHKVGNGADAGGSYSPASASEGRGKQARHRPYQL